MTKYCSRYYQLMQLMIIKTMLQILLIINYISELLVMINYITKCC